MIRRFSKPIKIGNVTIGGGSPIVVQSMTKTDTRDIKATVDQIKELEECGCEVVRVGIPDKEAAQAISSIKASITIPIIADIHFDYQLALFALDAGVDGLRLNPGNISEPGKISIVAKAAKERQIPIRIGVNAGSLPHTPSDRTSLVERMVNLALEQIEFFESLDFRLIEVSLKASDVLTTIEANKAIAWRMPYPLHLGITEAGLPRTGSIRSAVGIGSLLYLGIGDTIRVSLSTHPREEVFVAYEILKSFNLREHGPILISCPSCSRAEVDIIGLAETVEKNLRGFTKPIKVAVMGCVVNGPGEAREADIGIACGKGRGVVFRKGEIVATVNEKDFLKVLSEEIARVSTS